MMTMNVAESMEDFQALVDWGTITAAQLRSSGEAAQARDVEVEEVLRYDLGIPRRKLLEALALRFRCEWVEYDERLPVPPELLEGLDPARPCSNLWFPVALDDDTVVIAVRDPSDPLIIEEVADCLKAEKFRFHVALAEDISYFIEDFLNSHPSHLIGNERTALALWRNTMARWRTKLASYRTDFARVRTQLSLLRGGLTMIVIGRTLVRSGRAINLAPVYWAMMGVGLLLIFLGLLSYHRVKKSIFCPPKHETLVEVTAASLYFLENYQFAERGEPGGKNGKKTMLARLSDMAHRTVTIIEPSYDNKPRSQLAHERNLFAAQRTIAACYRTIYSRARTGLSFIRTGVSFASVGVGLITYFGLSLLNIVDAFIILAGLLMVVDGILWSWPVRKENYEALKCAVSF